MKLLYSKGNWSCVGFSDLLAPIAKMQLKGSKLVIAAPYSSVAASMSAAGQKYPPTIAALSRHMLYMSSLTDFRDSGGMCVVMKEGDFFWIPECSLIGEFNLGDSKSTTVFTNLSWVAMTKYHCRHESLSHLVETAKSILGLCCQPSEKWQEQQLEAGWVWEDWFRIISCHTQTFGIFGDYCRTI